MIRRRFLKQRRTDPLDRKDEYSKVCLAVDEANLSVPPPSEDFQSACLDTGAQETAIGMQQADACELGHGKGLALGPPRRNVFRFGGGRHASVGALEVRMPITQEIVLELTVDVIELDVPLLLGLEKMEKHRMYFNNMTNRLICVNEGVGLLVVRALGHASYVCGSDMLYTNPEL